VVPGIASAGWLGWGAALLTALCAYKTHNVLLSMLVGMIIVAAGRAVL
jgi:branched-subunit amino acid transport protein